MTPLPVAIDCALEHLPTYAHSGDAGADLVFAGDDTRLEAGSYGLFSTGVKMALPEGYVGLIHPRSGLAAKHGITVLNAPGTIDSGYRGIVSVCLVNHGSEAYVVKSGERIAQLLVQRFETIEPVSGLLNDDMTVRGAGGFGSTGQS